MSEETIIGPQRCVYCGGEYGEHEADCRTRNEAKNAQPSQFAIDAANELLPHRAIMSSPESQAEYRIQQAIDAACTAACAAKDAEIAWLKERVWDREDALEGRNQRVGELEREVLRLKAQWREGK